MVAHKTIQHCPAGWESFVPCQAAKCVPGNQQCKCVCVHSETTVYIPEFDVKIVEKSGKS